MHHLLDELTALAADLEAGAAASVFRFGATRAYDEIMHQRLETIGEAARRLERALDPTGPSPFTNAMRSAVAVADALWRDVERAYLAPLE